MEAISSKYELIQKRLEALEETSLLGRLLYRLPKKFECKVMVPNELYARAEALCDDIVQMREEDKDYTQGELANYIFGSFLKEVRKQDNNLGGLFHRLNVRKEEIPMVNDNPLVPYKSRTSVTVKLDKEDALRAEWFLNDVSSFVTNHKMDKKELIELVYLDFLVEYSMGRRRNVIKEILDSLDN